jgi:hypothetical protein
VRFLILSAIVACYGDTPKPRTVVVTKKRLIKCLTVPPPPSPIMWSDPKPEDGAQHPVINCDGLSLLDCHDVELSVWADYGKQAAGYIDGYVWPTCSITEGERR